MIAGGVGIAGLISMARTMADRNDVRPAVLFYGNRDWDDVAFRDDLERLKDRLDLTLVHVLERTTPGWQGETGYVTADVLERHLPPGYRRFQFFICGPDPMMDAAEAALIGLGVPPARVHTERFDMVGGGARATCPVDATGGADHRADRPRLHRVRRRAIGLARD